MWTVNFSQRLGIFYTLCYTIFPLNEVLVIRSSMMTHLCVVSSQSKKRFVESFLRERIMQYK